MEMDPNPPSFNIQAQIPTTNIGAGYAAGIAQAGQSLAQATSGVMDVMNRNRTADDTLAAMQQNKMLTPDQYNSVANKSLGAKEQMLGMYAGQWIAQQAQQRALQQAGYQGNVQIAVEHAKLLDTIQAVKSGYGAAVGVQPGKLQVAPATGQGATAQSAPVLAPLQAGKGVPALSTAVSGTTGAPTPLGSSDITNPQLVTSPQLAAVQAQKAQQTKLNVGPALSGKDPVPPGGRVGSVSGQRGVLMPDGVTFRPFQ
jgi:hypothetical protein